MKHSIFSASLLLTATMFSACGERKSEFLANETIAPVDLPIVSADAVARPQQFSDSSCALDLGKTLTMSTTTGIRVKFSGTLSPTCLASGKKPIILIAAHKEFELKGDLGCAAETRGKYSFICRQITLNPGGEFAVEVTGGKDFSSTDVEMHLTVE